MCGRYVIDVTNDLSGIKTIIEEAQRRAQVMDDSAGSSGNPTVRIGEVHPGDTAAVLLPYRVSADVMSLPQSVYASEDDADMRTPVQIQTGLELRSYPMVWGYPGFERSNSKRIFNARIEQAAQKPIWRDSIAMRRCIVPCNGFYEWKKRESLPKAKKQRYLFQLKNEPLLYMAGIYRNLTEREQEESGHVTPKACFSILTTQPNRYIREIHDRMPVVLRKSELAQWLYGDWEALANREELELETCLEAGPLM